MSQKRLACLYTLALLLSAAPARAAEYNVLPPLRVDGAYAVFLGTAEVQGNAFSVGGSTLVVKNGRVGVGTVNPGVPLEVAGQVKITGGTPGANKVLTTVDGTGLATWESLSSLVQGDSLGTHIATKTLDMASWNIIGVSSVNFKSNVFLTSATAANYGGVYVSTNLYVNGLVKAGSLALNAGATVNDLSDDTTLGDNSASALPTERAVKQYVDSKISAGGGDTTWVRIGVQDLSSAQTSVTFSGLNGDADVEYILSAMIVNGYAGSTYYRIRPNNDSAANYGYQSVRGAGTTAGASVNTTETGMVIAVADNATRAQSQVHLHAKSGRERASISNYTTSITGTSMGASAQVSNSWNNTAANITSLVIVADQTNGLGAGTRVELWARKGVSGTANTLDQSYDQGGPGAGRSIVVDAGAVQLAGNNAADEALEVTNSAAGGALLVENTGTGLSLRVNDEAADTSPLVVDASGNVGVGMVSPQTKLHMSSGVFLVDGSGAGFRYRDGSQGASKVLTSDANGLATWATVASVGGADNLGSHVATKTITAGYGISGTTAVFSGSVTMGTATITGNSGVYGLTVSSNVSLGGALYTAGGRVGIGTASPGAAYALDINGGLRMGDTGIFKLYTGGGVADDYTMRVATHLLLSLANDTGTNRYFKIGRHVTGTFTPQFVVNAQNGSVGINDETPDAGLDIKSFAAPTGFALSVSSQSDVAGDMLSVRGDGNVGIGTASPGARLEVAGQVKITGGSPGVNKVLTSDGAGLASWVAPGTLVSGDSLGSHIATQTLQMGAYGINTSSNISAARYQINGSTMVAILPGTDSIAYGVYAGTSNITGGDYNVFIGNYAGDSNTTGNSNTATGYGALRNNTTGVNNTATGYRALYYNTTGGSNIASGYQALYSNTTGVNNIASGYRALYYSTTGGSNIASGLEALYSNTTGSYNTAIGHQALFHNQTGHENTVFGSYAGGPGGAGGSFSSSTIVGAGAGYYTTTGSNNVFLGWRAGYNTTTGASNIVIGYDQRASAAGASNELNIGGVLYGNLSAKTIGISTRAPQAALDIVSTGSAATDTAQIWRNSGGTIISSMSATGNLHINGQIKIAGGSPGANKVLTSDGAGLASWVAPGTLVSGDSLGSHVATKTITANYGISGSTADFSGGYYMGGLSSPVSLELTRTIPTTVNNYIEIGNFSLGSGAHNFRVSITNSDGSYSTAKTYLLPVYYGATAGAWKIVPPISDGGPYSGNNHELDINVNNNVASLRIRRTAGSTAGTARVRIESVGQSNDVFTPTTGTGSDTAPTALYGSLYSSVVNNNVGVGTLTPGARLDVLAAGSTSTDTAHIWRNAGGTIVSSMSATGTLYLNGQIRIVGGSPGVNKVLTSDSAGLASWVAPGTLVSGDSLGTHIATKTLDMSDFGIANAAEIYNDGGVHISSGPGSVTSGLFITSNGNIYTTGRGLSGTIYPNARGLGAVEFQIGRAAATQVASGQQSFIGGGTNNTASGSYSVVAGGMVGAATMEGATVGGGEYNKAYNTNATVSGGYSNVASGNQAVVSGGGNNTASGQYGAVPGGYYNTALGQYSWAGGHYSSSTANGAFTWSDSQGVTVTNNVTDRVWFKNRGGFLVTGSTQPSSDGGFFVSGAGKVGIGTASPGTDLEVAGQVKITGGSPGANKVLTSDAAGLASWVAPGTLVSGDSLGTHIATKTLDMDQFSIVDITTLAVPSTTAGLHISTGGTGSLLSTDGLYINPGKGLYFTGPGLGGTSGTSRGASSIDLQAYRTGAAQVASGNYAVLAGGQENTASGGLSTVSGGGANTASQNRSTVAGGYDNVASAQSATVSGGESNIASGQYAAVAGGRNGKATGNYAMIAGGYNNTATGSTSWAAGYASSSTQSGAFTWADSKGFVIQNNVLDRTLFKNEGGFMVTGSTVSGSPTLPANQAMLDIISSGTAANIYAQAWRNSGGTIVASMTSTGVLYATLPSGVGADNLGNHIATTDLKMGANQVTGTGALTMSSGTFTGLGVRASNLRIGTSSTEPGRIRFYDYTGYLLSPWTGTDADTDGLYWDTTNNQFQFHGAGNNRWSVDTDDGNTTQAGVLTVNGAGNNYLAGNLGLGVAPAYKLDVSGTARVQGQAIVTGTMTVQGSSGGYGMTVSSNVSLAGLLYTANGRVGISTSTPLMKLHVDGMAGFGDEGAFQLTQGSYYYPAASYYDQNPGSYLHSPGAMVRKDTSETDLRRSSATLVLYNRDGRDNTGPKLVFAGQENPFGTAPLSNAVALAAIGSQKVSGSGGGWATGNMKFLVKAGATYTDVMTMRSDGNVGISTGLPQARLDVLASGTLATDTAQIWRNSGGTIISSMSATGNLHINGQMKIAGGSPGAGKVLTSDANGLASWSTPASGADNLGDHTATQALDMAGFDINANHILGSSITLTLTDSAIAYSTAARVTLIDSNTTNGGTVKIPLLVSYVKTGTASETTGGNEAIRTSVRTQAGSVSELFGFVSESEVLSGSSVGYFANFRATPDKGATKGTLTERVGLEVSDIGMPVTRQYGILIGNMTSGTSRNYAIYSAGGQNYFAGDIRASSFTAANALGVGAPQVKFANNVLISSATAAQNGGVYLSTHIYVNGKLRMVDGTQGADKILISDANGLASWGSVSSVVTGDSLGSHIATKTLDMEQFAIVDITTLAVPSTTAGLHISTGGTGSLLSTDGLYINPGKGIYFTGKGNNTFVGNARGIGAVDLQTNRFAATNVANGQYATISGGQGNTASLDAAVVSGGAFNTASNIYAVVPGGYSNTASGQYSFAAGYNATSSGHGAFTWADSRGVALTNPVQDRTVFKNVGGFLVTGSTNTAMTGTANRGVFITGNGFVGISTGVPAAPLDVVPTGDTVGYYSQIWRNGSGTIVASMTATGVLYADGSSLRSIAGDNLGNHTATTNLKMGANQVTGTGALTMSSGTFSNALGILAYRHSFGSGVEITSTTAGGSAGVYISTYVYTPGMFIGHGGVLQSTGTGLGTVAGNARGNGATDLQVNRSANTMVASGAYSVITGGQNNISAGIHSAVVGGTGNTAGNQFSFVGGGNGNNSAGTASAIAGGQSNTASGDHAFIGGGQSNIIGAVSHASIGGGSGNSASGQYAAILGGYQNVASAYMASVGGGDQNRVTASYGTIAGGEQSRVHGNFATVPGGLVNTAIGAKSFAAGSYSSSTAQGAFTWADSQGGPGYVIQNNTQDRTLFKNVGGFMVTGSTVGGSAILPNNQGMLDVISSGTGAGYYAQVWRNGGGTVVASMTSTGQLFADISGSLGGGDNLGNHTATQNLKMSNYWLSNDGGSEGVYVTAAGDVGIGTSNPSKKFEVNGDIVMPNTSGLKSIYTYSGSDANWRIGMSDNPGFTRALASSFVSYLTYPATANQGFAVGVNGGDSSFEITGSNHNAFFRGRVAMGGSDPGTSRLYVADTNSAATGLGKSALNAEMIQAIADTNDKSVIGVQATTNHGSGNVADLNGVRIIATKGAAGTVGSAAGLKVGIRNTNATGAITSAYGLYIEDSVRTGAITNDYGIYQAGTSAKNYFGGSVGIGTNTPSAKLSVYDTANSAVVMQAATPGTANTQQANLNLLTLNDGVAGQGVAGTKGWTIYARGNAWSAAAQQNDLGFTYWNGTTWGNNLYLDSVNGYVGIGTGNPGTKLQVGDGTEQVTMKLLGVNSGNKSPVLSLFNQGSREGFIAQTLAGMYIGNTGGLANYNDSTMIAAANLTISQTNGNIGISTGTPQARLDLRASADTAGTSAQIWRNASGAVVASMTATGVLYATVASGDNLGNHTATQALDMSEFAIIDITTLAVPSTTAGLHISTGGTGSLLSTNGLYVDPGKGLYFTGPGNNTFIGNARGTGAVDLQTYRTAVTQAATAIYSAISGGVRNTASGNYSVVGGGSINLASGTSAVVSGGSNNTASGGYSVVAGGGGVTGGYANNATNTGAAVSGGAINNAGGQYSSVSGGYANTASADYSTVGGGRANTAGGNYSFSAGYGSSSSANGAFTWADSQGTAVINSSADRTVFKNRGGFMVTPLTGTLEANQAMLDVVSSATASNVYAQVWRNSSGVAVASMTSTGILYADASGLRSVAGDNLGNHTATSNIKLGSNKLVYDGVQGEGFKFVNSDGKASLISNPTAGSVPPSLILESNIGWGALGGNEYQDLSASSYNDWTIAPPATIRFLTSSPGAYSSAITFRTKNDNASYQAATDAERMRITYDGKVGIGVDTPNSLLHVAGGASPVQITASYNDGAATYGELLFRDTSSNHNKWSVGANSDSRASGNFYIYQYYDAGEVLQNKYRLSISSTGNMGVNTQNPSYSLEVSSNTGGMGFQVDTSNAASGYISLRVGGVEVARMRQ